MDISNRLLSPHLDREPCNFDPQVLPDLILKQQLAKEKREVLPYQLVEAGQEDWDKVRSIYETPKSKIPKYEIANVQVIVNRLFSEEFNCRLQLLQERGKQQAFQSNSDSDSQILGARGSPERLRRQKVLDHLEGIVKSPKDFENAKVVMMCHGTQNQFLDNIFRTNLANLSLTDPGFFGKGVYHTSSASYAYRYTDKSGQFLMNWICFSSAYPVIHHPEIGDDVKKPDEQWKLIPDDLKKKHWVYLNGRQGSISAKYNAHYILVCPPKNPRDDNYYPFTKETEEICDEFVSFDPSQVLPRYLITLGPDLGHIKQIYTSSFFQHLQETFLPLDLAKRAVVHNRPLSPQELIECGHLLCIQQIKDAQIKQESIQYLREQRAIAQVRKQLSLYSSSISFDQLFKPCSSPWEKTTVVANHFETVQDWIDKGEFQLAITSLLPLFRSNADIALCYTYLFLLFDHITDWQTFANHTSYLLDQSSDCSAHHRQFAIALASHYTKRGEFSNAIRSYAKAMSIKESQQVHHLASKVFIKIMFPYIESFIQKSEDGVLCLKKVGALERFYLNKEDRESFYALVQKKISQSKEQSEQYITLQNGLFTLQAQPFHSPTLYTTERYWKASRLFTEQFNAIKDIQNVRQFQRNATQSFVSFFEILLDDAFVLLGPPPCAYDIRAEGSIARGEISLYLDLACVILLDHADPYFDSLTKILTDQLLTVGIQVKFKLLLAHQDINYDLDLLKTMSLTTNNPKLFTHYRAECRKIDFPPPTLDVKAFNKEWQEDVTLDSIQKQYAVPLTQFLSDLALNQKIDHTNMIDIIGALQIFTPNSQVLLQESVELLYRLSFYNAKKTVKDLQDDEVAALQRCHWLVLSPLYSNQLHTNFKYLSDLPYISRTKGYDLNYELKQFHKDMKRKLIGNVDSGIKITGAISGDLDPKFLNKIDGEGNLIRECVGTHQVCKIHDFHLKQKPFQPLMEYAIHNLYSRIAGDLTPCVELVRFDIGKKFYPVLISRTIQGKPWSNGQQLDLKQWTRMLLCAILTRPGDGSLSNYILNDKKIYCIDNDHSFVEPAEVNWHS